MISSFFRCRCGGTTEKDRDHGLPEKRGHGVDPETEEDLLVKGNLPRHKERKQNLK